MTEARDRVKILFPIAQDEDGYPPVEVESLWGIRTSEGIELDNIPFYARGVSLGDLVKVREAPDGALEFESVIRRGGHSTYRLLLAGNADAPARTMTELTSLGLGVEQDLGPLLAVDVPPDVPVHDLLDYLLAGVKTGRWEVEEGYRAGSAD